VTDIVEFLRARLDEDEAWGRSPECGYQQDPARVLREVEAKRRIVESCSPQSLDNSCADPGERCLAEVTLEALALPYSDHPDYQPEWNLT
jgi:hypothetical protein